MTLLGGRDEDEYLNFILCIYWLTQIKTIKLTRNCIVLWCNIVGNTCSVTYPLMHYSVVPRERERERASSVGVNEDTSP